jgi:hypothetical protein
MKRRRRIVLLLVSPIATNREEKNFPTQSSLPGRLEKDGYEQRRTILLNPSPRRIKDE